MNIDKKLGLKYAVYARKSSESKERQALSIQDQNTECREYIDRTGLSVVKWIQESKSAYKPNNRPEFDLMIEMIKSGKVEAVLTWKPDRLCRNPEEGGKILQMLQDGLLKEIRTVAGDVYTQESDHLILQIHFGMANQFSRNLSQTVRRGLVRKCERGEYPRPAPLGYESFGERGKRQMRLHPVEAPLIEKLFKLAATGGISLSQLSKKMSEEGLKTKRGKKVSKSHIYTILTRPTYYGYFLHNGETYDGDKYPPLISKQLYDQVQNALTKRSKPKIKVWEHTYNGLITCGECGCQITTTVKEKFYKRTNRTAVYTYHHCTHRKGKCSQEAITGKKLEKMLIKAMANISISQDEWQLGIDLFKAKHEEEMGKLNKKLSYYQNQFKSVREQLSELVKMRARKELTQEEFLEQKKELLNEKKDLEEKIKDNDYSADTWLELCTRFLNTAFTARETMEKGTPEEKRDLILDLGENLILKDKNIVFNFKTPYDVLLSPEHRQSMLGRLDSNQNKQLQRLLSYH